MHGARSWLGIPYATAARFARPERVPWNRDLTPGGAFGPAAPQLPGDDVVPDMKIGATDEARCLSLNVWAPRRAEVDADADITALPVLVWFHGGAFVLGASSQASHAGDRLAVEQNVVVVSANYRLGAFGFLDTRAIGGDAANFGLHDAIAALQWVHDNIAAFGGDPARVTVFGLSAGGGVGLHLLAAPRAAGLFEGVIVQSGVTDRTLDAERAALVATTLCEAAGVVDVDGLRGLDTDALLAAQGAALVALIKPIGVLPFHPCIDGELVPGPPTTMLGGGAAAGVRLLAGSTSQELNFNFGADAAVTDPDRLVAQVRRYLRVEPEVADAIVRRYAAELGDAAAIWPTLLSDVEMQLPLRRVLEARTSAGAAETWAYLFTWEAPDRGAFHAVDIPFTFDTFDVDGWGEFVGYDTNADRLGRELRTAWAAFARAGDPGWAPFPTTHVFGRTSADAAEHPLFARQQDYWPRQQDD
jgi:para-nitrobenzyl esterase